MNSPEVVIIPDVHGRKFWKEALDKFPKEDYPNLKIVFLGDYLDPYTGYEPITSEDAYNNFLEILEYAKSDSRIILLIGNHDWHYFVNLDTCRMDFARERMIEKLFVDNISLFRLTYTIELDECKYLFSHAGVTQKWLNDVASMAEDEFNKWNPGDPSSENYVDPEVDDDYKWIEKVSHINETHNFELLESCLKNYDNTFYTAPISMVSRDRGGWYPHGSLIWADVYEHLYNEDLKGFYQIFGHTITFPNGKQYDAAISPGGHCWSMIDASKAFILDIEGNITEV